MAAKGKGDAVASQASSSTKEPGSAPAGEHAEGTAERVLTLHTTGGVRRFAMPLSAGRLSRAKLEEWGLNYAGFATPRHVGQPFAPASGSYAAKQCVPLSVRVAAGILCHRFGLDPWLRHLGPIGRGDEQRPRITRDGLLHCVHRGTPENHYRSMLDGITFDPNQPVLHEERGERDAGGEWSWVVQVWLKGHRKPVMGRGTSAVKRFQKVYRDNKDQGKQWVVNEHAPSLAYKQAVYSALLHAVDLSAFAVPDHLMSLIEASVFTEEDRTGEELLLEEHGQGGDGGAEHVNRDTGEVTKGAGGGGSAGAGGDPSGAGVEQDEERAAMQEEPDVDPEGGAPDGLPF